MGAIVYLPPEAKDVPGLMQELTDWIQTRESELPIPIIARIAHYQFITVHPFYDGNGRTARALATWVLYRGGYDLGKFYALEEFYAQDLTGYYAALVTHPHHNYYEGRISADITQWLFYFLKGVASDFEMVASLVRQSASQAAPSQDPFLRTLDRRGRIVLGLFIQKDEITSADVARMLGLSLRQVRELLSGWVSQGWLQTSDPSRKGRKYILSADYRRLIG
jgi:Fic family protein